ncbi:hypothetical protein ACIQWA_06450, partial [Kitasatospora sp. NPDC098652]
DFIQVFGEQYTDQGNLGITIDGGTQQIVNTVPSDGKRHANVPVYSAGGLGTGNHTITVTKLSGQYATLDGFTTAPATPTMLRANDTATSISYSGFSYHGKRGFGDLGDDIHYATADGSTATYSFSGDFIQVFGEQYTDQGNLGITIDGGTQQIVNTVPADGKRHANVPVYTAGGLGTGNHTITVTKLSGQYATLDGFAVIQPPAKRVDDTASSISYSGFSLLSNRGFGDLGNDVHYATADGSTATYSFSGDFIQVFGEQSTDQGNLGITIDGGTQQIVNTVPADGKRHANVPIYSAGGLGTGNHTITVTKLSGQYATLDGFGTP